MGFHYPSEPSEISEKAEQEHLEEFAEQLHKDREAEQVHKTHEADKAHQAAVAEHHAHRSASSMLGGILTLAGAVLVFVATISPSGPVNFMHGHLLYSIGTALMWWGPVALLLVAGVLALTSGPLLRAMAGGLAMGVAGVVLLHFVAYLFAWIDFDSTVGWAMFFGLIGSAVSLVGGLVALRADAPMRGRRGADG